jgi:hypothetical protein
VIEVTALTDAWLNSVCITHPWFSFRLWLDAPALLAFKVLPVGFLDTGSQVIALNHDL